ncbi:MAG: N-acyl homoserine lactonase family protein [Thermoplasmata archaeon]|nr:N-acyl homoserine lactonase family protein [Candidatus Sysuiplasma acidicola]MBX8645334.1 N-acyl homoserine lactonase family protein [Candidatus Sysuiplasma acidicola]MDH2904851.1 N-acyl homoserine lactonase family protein [Methanomassiliicoccales archaeon]
MPVKEVHLLEDGYLELDMGMLVYMKTPYYGIKYMAALKPLLVRTDNENIIVDTGIAPLPDSLAKHVRYTKKKDIVGSLSEFGLTPDDITIVVNTHLHMDHCGNNRLFRKARYFVQKQELHYANNPDRWMRGGYVREFFNELQFELVDGDSNIASGLNVIETPGHTPGHQSVVIEAGGKRIVYMGDACPLMENLERRDVTGIMYDPKSELASIDRLRAIGGDYIASHDLLQMKYDLVVVG